MAVIGCQALPSRSHALMHVRRSSLRFDLFCFHTYPHSFDDVFNPRTLHRHWSPLLQIVLGNEVVAEPNTFAQTRRFLPLTILLHTDVHDASQIRFTLARHLIWPTAHVRQP